LRSGANQIAILLYPVADPPEEFRSDAKLVVRLVVQEAGALDKPEREIATLAFQGAGKSLAERTEGSTAAGELDSSRDLERARHGDVTIGPMQMRPVDSEGMWLLSRDIELALPFPEWAFLRSESMKPFFELTGAETIPASEALIKAYEPIWKLLQARDVGGLLPFFEERSRELDQAMYLSDGTTQAKLKESFERVFSDKTRALAPLRPTKGYWIYDVGPTGVLARLSWGKHGGAILRFRSTEEDGYMTVYPIMFRKQGDRYIVSR
jgi:hypothetical protein